MFYLLITHGSVSICKILSVSVLKLMHQLTKAMVAILQLITCSVTVFGVRKKSVQEWTRHNEKKEHSHGSRCINITESNQCL